MKAQVKKWLEQGDLDIFLGYKIVEGHALPHCFTRERLEEIEEIVVGPARYPLEKMAQELTLEEPDIKIGLLTRDCNNRALNVLFLWNQLNPENVKTLPVNCCPSQLKDQVNCSLLDERRNALPKKDMGIEKDMNYEALQKLPGNERFNRWLHEFEKCIKCYGCRDACPVCFCKECSLEHEELVSSGELPVEVPIFHMVRAVHMAGRCVDCGLCEEACPMDIPLRALYGMVNHIVVDQFDYHAGADSGQSPFNILGDDVGVEPKQIGAA